MQLSTRYKGLSLCRNSPELMLVHNINVMESGTPHCNNDLGAYLTPVWAKLSIGNANK